MGIRGIKKYFEEISEEKELSNFKGKKILIDTIYILYKQGIGNTQNLNSNYSNLMTIILFTINILEKGLLPIFVFDGKMPIEKNNTLKKRSLIKTNAINVCNITEDKLSDIYKKNLKKSFHITPKEIELCKKIIVLLGIPIIQAPMEADSQLAALSNITDKNIIGVLSQDSDVLLYGGKNIMNNYSFKNNKITETNRIKILNKLCEKANEIRIENKLNILENFTHENFLDYSLLLGSDYKPTDNYKNIYIFGLTNYEKQEKIFELFVINDMNVKKIINYIKESDKIYGKNNNVKKNIYCFSYKNKMFSCEIDDNYYENWLHIKNLYLDSNVIDPKYITKEMLEFKKPCIKEIFTMLKTENKLDEKFIKEKLSMIQKFYMISKGIIHDNYNKNFSDFNDNKFKYYLKQINKINIFSILNLTQ
jgi:flap endonuclease-1